MRFGFYSKITEQRYAKFYSLSVDCIIQLENCIKKIIPARDESGQTLYNKVDFYDGKDRENKTYGTLLDGIMCRFIY